MSVLTFKTALTEDEIDKNFENFDMFSELMGSLEECLEYEKGNTKKLLLFIGGTHSLKKLFSYGTL